jgi:hypothetical protein
VSHTYRGLKDLDVIPQLFYELPLGNHHTVQRCDIWGTLRGMGNTGNVSTEWRYLAMGCLHRPLQFQQLFLGDRWSDDNPSPFILKNKYINTHMRATTTTPLCVGGGARGLRYSMSIRSRP